MCARVANVVACTNVGVSWALLSQELADVIRAFREADAEGKGSMDEDEKGARVGGDDAKAGGGARAGGKRPAPAAAPPKAGSGDTAQAVGKGSPAHKPGGGKQ